jgi:hypothetical protein
MRKCKLCLFALLLTALCAPAQDGGPVAKPLQYTFNLPSIEELPKSMRYSRYENIGCEITYLVVCDGLVSIDSDSIKITSITSKDGKDLPLKGNFGRNSWNYKGSTASSTDRNPCITFSVFFPTETPMEVPVVKGTITAKVAGMLEAQVLNFKTAEKGVAQKAGPFTFAMADDTKEDADGNVNLRLFGGDRKGGFKMTMEGDGSLIKDITINDGGKTIRQMGHSSFFTQTTRNGQADANKQTIYSFFPAPTAPEFTLTVTYFSEMLDVPVTLGQ